MAVTMTARTAAAIVTAAMAAIRPLPSVLQTVLYIIPIAHQPVQLALHQFIGARRDMERISTGMVTVKHVNETGTRPCVAVKMLDERGII